MNDEPHVPWSSRLVKAVIPIIVLGFLIAVVGPNFRGGLQESAISRAEAQMRHLSSALEMWIHQHGTLPPGGLQDLTTTDADTGEPWLAQVPVDPWGHSFRLTSLHHERKRYRLASAGEDGLFDTDDDIVWPKYSN